MDEHISTLMCAWYLVVRWRLYGTIHRLSTTRCVFGSTKMRVWRRRYLGYPLTSQCVSSLKERGYLFLHFPCSMHCALRKSGPHGPCTMHKVTVSYASGWRIESEISVDTIESKSSAMRNFDTSSKMSKMCAWGKPLFWNLMTQILAITLPRTPSLMSLKRVSSFKLKMRVTNSGRSLAVYPRRSASVISFHLGLQVNVTKRFGLPNLRTLAMASWYSWPMARLPPWNDDGRIIFCPTSFPRMSRAFNASWRPLYRSQLNCRWFSRINFKRFCSVHAYVSTMNCYKSLPARRIHSWLTWCCSMYA